MRFGGPDTSKADSPEAWVAFLKERGYRAAYYPLPLGADPALGRAYVEAARKADLMIAEVGVWDNPINPDATAAAAAFEKCKNGLALADQVGACCCVNIGGTRTGKWTPDLSETTFEMIVDSIRQIIDAVKPTRTFYTLEAWSWLHPDTPDAYLRLIKAVDRKAFAVHLDPVNWICTPRLYFDTQRVIEECFAKLGPYIKSCHAKDILLQNKLTVVLDEVRPGLGVLDYAAFLRGLNRLHPDTPIMLEHLSTEEEYRLAAAHIRSVAAQQGINL